MVPLEQPKWTLAGNFIFHLILVIFQGARGLGILKGVAFVCGFDLTSFFSSSIWIFTNIFNTSLCKDWIFYKTKYKHIVFYLIHEDPIGKNVIGKTSIYILAPPLTSFVIWVKVSKVCFFNVQIGNTVLSCIGWKKFTLCLAHARHLWKSSRY